MTKQTQSVIQSPRQEEFECKLCHESNALNGEHRKKSAHLIGQNNYHIYSYLLQFALVKKSTPQEKNKLKRVVNMLCVVLSLPSYFHVSIDFATCLGAFKKVLSRHDHVVRNNSLLIRQSENRNEC